VANQHRRQNEAAAPALMGRMPADYITGELPPTAQRILAAAQHVLMRDGYKGLTLQRIADEAGVGKSLVTYHLESKATLMAMLVDSLWHDVDVELFNSVEKLPLLSARRIGALMDAHRRLGGLTDQQRMYVDLFANLTRTPETRRRMGALNDSYRDLGRRCLGATGLLGEELRALASLVLAVGDGMGVGLLVRPREIDDDAVYAVFEDMVVALAGGAVVDAPSPLDGAGADAGRSQARPEPRDRAALLGADPQVALAPVARQLVRGAQRVLRKRGFQALTLEAVGREAGEPPSAVTYYFGDKHGLIAALIAARMFAQRKVAVRLFAAPRGERTCEAGAICAARELLTDMTSFRAYFDLLPVALREPGFRAQQADHERWLADLIAAGLAESGEPAIAAHAGALAILSVAAADGLAMQVLADPSGFDPAPSCALLERLICRHAPSPQTTAPPLRAARAARTEGRRPAEDAEGVGLLKLGVDVGGTFTDICLLDAGSGEVWVDKLPSTVGDQSVAFVEGVMKVLEKAERAAADIDFLVHGTTVATNALLEHKGARTALLTTRGFRDVLEIGTQQRRELYSVVQSRPPVLVPRRLRREVGERVAADGEVVTPLDEAEARRVLAELAEEGVETLAVCLLFSFMNPAHERRLAELAAEIMPQTMVSLSSAISPEYREYWRMSTTAVNAYVIRPVFGYIGCLEERLRENGVTAGLHVMQSSGGLMTAATTRERPVNTILSGPVGGVGGGAFFGLSAGFRNLVTFDMGGTSCDVATVVDGEPGRTHLKEVEGYPLRTPMVDIETIGAGGGSIARVDAGGGLKVGPQSAGAEPGPACYGKGGVQPTVSDADLVVGVLGADTVLGRDLGLDADAAREAVDREIARPLGLSLEEAAAGIIALANTNMRGAIRVITVQKGLDPRDFSLVAFGGAGPMHACAVAREASIPRVIVPPHPGITSAVGLLMADIRHPMLAAFIVPTARADFEDAERVLAALRAEAEGKLLDDGVPAAATAFKRSVDMRYVGQAYELTIPCDEPLAGGAADGALARLVARFHETHERVYGHHSVDEPTQLVNLRVEGIGSVPRGAWRERIAARHEYDRNRQVYVHGEGWLDTPVLDRSRLRAGESYPGPLVVEQLDTTVWIPPRDVARIDEHGTIVVEVAL